MRDRLWAEIIQWKFNIEYITLFSDRQRWRIRFFNILILAFSSSGIMGWTIWENFPLIACSIIALISLLRYMRPVLTMDNDQLSKLDTIHKYYIDNYNNLEQLWFEFQEENLTEKEVCEKFYEIKGTESEVMIIISDTLNSKPKRLAKKAKEASDDYFKRVFNTQHNG